MHLIAEIRTTFPDRSHAEACAERLVATRLAACVQIDGPVRSAYRWQGVVERADEWRCTCKTTIERGDACSGAIATGHPYGVPEILLTKVATSLEYAAWVREAVGECGDGVEGGSTGTDGAG